MSWPAWTATGDGLTVRTALPPKTLIWNAKVPSRLTVSTVRSGRLRLDAATVSEVWPCEDWNSALAVGTTPSIAGPLNTVVTNRAGTGTGGCVGAANTDGKLKALSVKIIVNVTSINFFMVSFLISEIKYVLFTASLINY